MSPDPMASGADSSAMRVYPLHGMAPLGAGYI